MLCKNCGGQVWREADGRHICFQCARPHDEDGSLIHPAEVGKTWATMPTKWDTDKHGGKR